MEVCAPMIEREECVFSNDSSPECLIPSDIITDPYPSDDDVLKQKDKAEKNAKPCIHYVPTYNGSNICIQMLKKCFNLKFVPLSESSAPDVKHLDVPQILDQLIMFASNRNYITGKELVGMLMEKLKVKESFVYFLSQHQAFNLNLKDAGTKNAVPNPDKTSKHAFQTLCHFMKDVVDLLKITGKSTRVYSVHDYNVVKMCVNNFCQLTGERVIRLDGECTAILFGGEDFMTTKSKNTAPMIFKAFPDILLSGTDCPAIPVEVYSPVKIGKNERTNTKGKTLKSAEEKSTAKSEFTDEESIKKFLTILSEHIPTCFGEMSQTEENSLKYKMLSQHILQILGAATQYCADKYLRKEKLHKTRVFIGLFVCIEYIYVTKLMGDETVFAKYYMEGKFPLDYNTRLDYINSLDPNIHVQFSPMTFDISVHNHRMALLLFLEYYMLMWDEMSIISTSENLIK